MSAKSAPKEKPRKRGCVARALFIISAASSLLLALALVFMVLPQDLSDIEGFGGDVSTAESRDLTQVLSEAVDRGHSVTLSEGEINRWIASTLKIKQEGLLAGQVKLSRLGVRLEEDMAEIIIERHVFGLDLTLSMHVQVLVEATALSSSKEVILHGGPVIKPLPFLKRGGRFGRLAVPQGYLYLVKPTFFQLGEVYEEELQMIFRKMHDIRIEDGKLVLHPRPSTASVTSP